MPGAAISETPSISLSFANNFWGKDDAGVGPLLERMHNAKVTSDELKSFYSSRAAIEEEYARKLLNLARKSLGSSEAGTLRMSLDIVRSEVESMGKAHQAIAGKMRTELEEPLAAFAGSIKERRKIVQNGIEKLLKVKTQQTAIVTKARDRYEQDCLKIKGYLAQGHMVMGQEERKNNSKLEKTKIQLAATSQEYEQAVKVLEETTGRWNRDWKAACDKFQDLEEERVSFTKSSLWDFANIASTICVSDDAACENIRLSLEDCEVEKDIRSFIQECGTGQEIPDPPKYIDFCRGDIDDNSSNSSEEGSYSVAQFQRTMNPAFRSSSPQPSVFESHHDPNNPLAKEFGRKEPQGPSVSTAVTSQPRNRPQSRQARQESRVAQLSQQQQNYIASQYDSIPKIPYNENPMDGMTQFCRFGPPSDQSSVASPVRPSSRDSQSDYSNPTSMSSVEQSSGAHSPVKQLNEPSRTVVPDTQPLQRKKSNFFQGHSPFRRKSKHEKEHAQHGTNMTPSNRNSWAPTRSAVQDHASPARQSRGFVQNGRGSVLGNDRTDSPEPVDPRASFQLNIGNNVFDVASPDAPKQAKAEPPVEEDPMQAALRELEGVTKQTSLRVSADRFHGLSTPVPSTAPSANAALGAVPAPFASSAQRNTPPPSYDQPVSRLGAPQPAFTAKQMQETKQKYIEQKQNMFSSPARPTFDTRGSSSRPPTRGRQSQEMVRATSPAPLNTAAQGRRGSVQQGGQSRPPSQQAYRAPSPNPYASNAVARPRAQSSSPIKPREGYGSWNSRNGGSVGPGGRGASPQPHFDRQATQAASRPGSRQSHFRQSQGPSSGAVSPAPTHYGRQAASRGVSPAPTFRQPERPQSSRGSDMALQLASAPGDNQAYERGRRSVMAGSINSRPTSSYYGNDGGYSAQGGGQLSTRVRSKSVAEPRQYTKDGRPILHYSRAMYMYQAQIPEEMTFAKGDVLAILHHQDDGWWEAEHVGKKGSGLVPSNYLQNC